MIIERKNNDTGLSELTVTHLGNGESNVVSFPHEVYSIYFWGAWDPQATKLWVSLQSMNYPGQILELDCTTCGLELLHTEPAPNLVPEDYVVHREYAQARDGESIPLTIVYKKGLELNGTNPAYVTGYGAYGYSNGAHYGAETFSLIDRGFVYCIAHIRGSSTKGNEWYLNGKMLKKMNTFNDFIDSCEYLVKRGYTAPKQIAIGGGSAGGLLMGAVTNMRPYLFKVVIADVAFVDVINTMSDATLPLTPPEWEEWGNPIKNKDHFDYIMSYSPYDNVTAQDYPAMLYNSGISDEQVTYWEPTKMVAKLRELKTDDNDLVLNMKMQAGHGGASQKYKTIREVAFNYTFVLKAFGIK